MNKTKVLGLISILILLGGLYFVVYEYFPKQIEKNGAMYYDKEEVRKFIASTTYEYGVRIDETEALLATTTKHAMLNSNILAGMFSTTTPYNFPNVYVNIVQLREYINSGQMLKEILEVTDKRYDKTNRE